MNWRLIYKMITCGIVMLAGMTVSSLLFLGGQRTLKMTIYVNHIMAMLFVRFSGIKAFLHGELNPGTLYVSNHQSGSDIIIHGSLLGVRFVAKGDDLMRRVLFFSRCIWADRRRFNSAVAVTGGIIDTLSHKISVMLYPEGTISDHGIINFKTTVFELAINNQKGITPVLTSYDQPIAWGKKESFFANAKRVVSLKALECRVYILPEMFPQIDENRRDFAQRVRTAMLAAQAKLNS